MMISSAKYLIGAIFVLFITKCDSCGVRQISHRELVTYGYETKPGAYPWHVAIYHQELLGMSYKCGGSLINENTVLTAAHCAFDTLGRTLPPQRMVLHLGKQNLLVTNTQTKEFRAKIIEIHPGFNASSLANDIAKVKLDGTVSYSQYIQPICLWDENRRSINEVENKAGTVVGWGFTEADKTSDSLREATMPITSFSSCLQSNRGFFGSFLSDLTFCAGYRNGTSVCNGDSGGGMYFEENGVWKLRGIVSISTNRESSNLCSTADYVLFTDVAQYLNWIDEPILNSGTNTRGCGKRNAVVSYTRLINRGEYPWHAMLYYRQNRGLKMACGGTLINKNTVLTVASCFFDYNIMDFRNKNLYTVRLGVHKLHQIDVDSTEIPIFKIITHPDFNSNVLWNDLGIAVLANDVTFTPYIQPACLWDPSNGRNLDYKVGSIVSWGRQLYENVEEGPERVNIPTVSEAACSTIQFEDYDIYLNYTTNFCGGFRNGSLTSCKSDIGAGLIFDVGGVSFLRGILSFALIEDFTRNCLKSEYVVFVDLDPYWSWIRTEINKVN